MGDFRFSSLRLRFRDGERRDAVLRESGRVGALSADLRADGEGIGLTLAPEGEATLESVSALFDFTFRRNRCVGLGGNAGSMFRVDGIGEGLRVENFTVADNVFEGDPSALSGFGIIISQEMAPWTGRNIAVCGNTVANTLFGWLVIDDYTFIDGLTVRDNTWSNAGGEYLLRSADDVGGYVFSGNEGTGERP